MAIIGNEEFVYTVPGDPRARPLVDELSFEYESRYGELFRQIGESAEREMARYPDELFTPARGGSFVLLLRDGVAVAGGAFKHHPDPHTAEVKRVWADKRLRRQGLATRILAELEAQALRQGYRRFYLTTGFRQPEAEALYLREGYTALFSPDANREALRALPFEKHLASAAPVARIAASQPAELSLR
ncbi:GNAT family N-acetyltransferase [Paucibacter sp. R3-3]|uniref:GNAT family N-acetyltransferase n=1 Tax=Roseateles agri TaxID=3098619 RepID=A0ABU5DKB3_9BURK|nr:GNAT family N-acetyltransferase [Paucibacter sp. R3-3]MDY0746743.1 GNAT family N-acetyltransferase [Paucibacter sp. R3-3]